MKVAIHEAEFGKHGFARFQAYRKVLEFNGIEFVNVHIDQLNFWEEIQKCDLFLYRWSQTDKQRQIAETILPVIEKEYGIKCFPDQATSWHFDDKVKQYYMLKSKNAPIINCHIFFNKQNALDWARDASYPTVFKLKGGAGSLNVVLVKNYKQAIKVINRIFGKGIKPGSIPVGNLKNYNLVTYLRKTLGPYYYYLKTGEWDIWHKHKGYALFQDFMPGNEFDTRVTIIGKRAFAFRRFNRKNDFRSSGSGLIDYDHESINVEMIKIAFDVCKQFKFQTMAFDFLYNNGNPEFCEISYTYDDSAVYRCIGYWTEDLEWIEGHFWPQYFHLVDALGKPDLRMPDSREMEGVYAVRKGSFIYL